MVSCLAENVGRLSGNLVVVMAEAAKPQESNLVSSFTHNCQINLIKIKKQLIQ